MQTPLLVISDAPTGPSGLGRITRELVQRIHSDLSDVFRVATLGYGGEVSKELPWPQYTMESSNSMQIPELPHVWEDFAGDEKGIVLCILNASWLRWFVDPSVLKVGELRSFLKKAPFQKWLYMPVDSVGPNDRLSADEKKVISGFDRVLAYTKFGADAIDRTMQVDSPFTPHLPHGTDDSVFYPRDRDKARETFIPRLFNNKPGKIDSAVTLIGVCATNSARKDWPLAFETCAELLRRGLNVGLWAHTDRFKGNWNLPALADEFGMTQRVIFSNCNLKDEDLAWAYAACDVTLGIGSEGWGLPISESLAMGVPCITGDYAGATEFVPPVYRMLPVAYRYDGYYNSKRPVFVADEWAVRIQDLLRTTEGKRHPLLANCFYWDNCWPQWAEWLREGLA